MTAVLCQLRRKTLTQSINEGSRRWTSDTVLCLKIFLTEYCNASMFSL